MSLFNNSTPFSFLQRVKWHVCEHGQTNTHGGDFNIKKIITMVRNEWLSCFAIKPDVSLIPRTQHGVR